MLATVTADALRAEYLEYVMNKRCTTIYRDLDPALTSFTFPLLSRSASAGKGGGPVEVYGVHLLSSRDYREEVVE